MNLADDVARGRIGYHNLLRRRERKSDQEQAEEEKTAWSLSEITRNGCVIEVIGDKSECYVQVNERLDAGESLRVNFTQTEEAVQICRDLRLRVVRPLRKEGAEE